MSATYFMRLSITMVLFSCALGNAAEDYHNELTLEHIGLVAPDILGLTFNDGYLLPAVQEEYVLQEGDEIISELFPHLLLKRDDEIIGHVGGMNTTVFVPFDDLVASNFDVNLLHNKASYVLQSDRDDAFSDGVAPVEIFRKTKPSNLGRTGVWEFSGPYTHVVYLKFPFPLNEGESYTLVFNELPLHPVSITIDSTELRSEAIHITQIGFRPDDVAKVAFLSCWMGNGGGLQYGEVPEYNLIDAVTKKVVHRGHFTLSKAAEDKDEDAFEQNYNKTDVYIADFSVFSMPGEYKLVIPGIGCSFPFKIDDAVWQEPFITSVRGLYHQRSGIALGAPYTDFVRPRNFHPEDGRVVYASTTQLIDTGNGPLAYGAEPDNFQALVRGRTDTRVENAWGGYHDAGDWDRRIQHLNATRYLFDLAELFPEYFNGLHLNIPESGSNLPDIIEEALFGLDVYRRLQTEEGGIRGGIESEEHPRYGETSWTDTLLTMAYAPDVWSSYLYAGTAAQAARYLAPRDPERAAPYQESAMRAMLWAESVLPAEPVARSVKSRNIEYLLRHLVFLSIAWLLFYRYSWKLSPALRLTAKILCILLIPLSIWMCLAKLLDGQYPPDLSRQHQINDARNYAAAEIYNLTEDTHWQDIFRNTSMLIDDETPLFRWRSHNQAEGAWVYARINLESVDTILQERCIQAIIAEAEERLEASKKTGYRWIKFPWRPFGLGVPTTLDALSVLRAHILTQEPRYLQGLQLAAQFGAGANPMNMSMTTGVGQVYPQNPLHLDSRFSGQPAPPGLTILGPVGMDSPWFAFWMRDILRPHVYPELHEWAPIESYMDVFWIPFTSEFTIHDTIAPNLLYWGYFAALPATQQN